MSKSDFHETQVLNLLRGVTLDPPATFYVALHTANPTDAGGGAEVSGGGYARVAITAAVGSWTAPGANAGAMEIDNTGEIAYPTSTAGWGTITHVGIWDAPTGGNLWYSAALTASRTVTEGTDVTFPAGTLTISEA